MSVWGKILGGVGGFAVGGPLGALIGVVAGHAVDKMRTSGEDQAIGGPDKQVAFTIAVIVLGAKMAKADGTVTRDEVDAFKQVFHIPPDEMQNVGKVFNQARLDAEGFEPYAKQVARMFNGNPALLEELLEGLFHIARADGQVKDTELGFLEQVASIFGFGEAEWDRIRAANLPESKSDPFRILGVTRDATDAEIKAKHRDLVRQNHPDGLVAQGMPAEFVEMANEKLARINAAYDEVRRIRKKT